MSRAVRPHWSRRLKHLGIALRKAWNSVRTARKSSNFTQVRDAKFGTTFRSIHQEITFRDHKFRDQVSQEAGVIVLQAELTVRQRMRPRYSFFKFILSDMEQAMCLAFPRGVYVRSFVMSTSILLNTRSFTRNLCQRRTYLPTIGLPLHEPN